MQQDSPLSEDISTPQETLGDVTSHKITRRSHRKSRAGCTDCKIRRIKCDEAKPQCANCARRQVRCSFDANKPLRNSENGGISMKIDDLQLSNIELTYHWTTTTSQSLSVWGSGAAIWQTLMEEVAFSHRHVLHLMFALTALHLAHCRATRREEYIATANRHYESALTSVTRAIAKINSNNCDAILLSVQLICFVSWARGPQPGEYLAFGQNEGSEWLVMFRGVRTTLESFGQHNFLKRHGSTAKAKSRPLALTDEPMGYEFQLSELREHVSITSPSSQREENLRAVDVLQECYANRYGGIDSEYHVAFAWLYRMSDSFLDQLQRRGPLPLIIYAHFVVLMHDMERFWYMKGWTNHVMSGIFEAMDTEHRAWIKWPMAKVGWIAP